MLAAKLTAKLKALEKEMWGTDTLWVSFDKKGHPEDVHKISAASPAEFADGAWQRYKDGWERIQEA